MESDKLKEIYDAGERLCSLAKEMGYSPGAESEESAEGESDMSDSGVESYAAPKTSRNAVSTAMSYMGK